VSGQIFISYRREESQWSARSLHDRLCRDFDPKQIFMDIDAIALGEDFVKAIETTVEKCDVLIAVIGNNWLASKDDRGDRRLDNPEDFVRMEIGTALKREIRVIPVLVDGASIPRSTELPDDLKPLVRRNALRITATSFDGDCQRLAATIRLVLEKAATDEREHEKDRLDAENRAREDADRADAQRRENERLMNERREKDRLEVERLEAERQRRSTALAQAREERERLESEHGQSKGNILPPSPAPSQDRGPAHEETPTIIQSKGSTKQKTSAYVVALLGGVVLMLILGLIWFAGSKLNHSGREATLVTPTPTFAPAPTATVSRGPTDPKFYSNRGLDFYDKKDYDKAISDFNEAIRLDPNYAPAYYYRGNAYYFKKDYDKAISDFNEAIRLDPKYAAAYYERGAAYREQGNKAQAQTDFDRAKLVYPR
jgi:tetratricopeptide (TPR) repeat protein